LEAPLDEVYATFVDAGGDGVVVAHGQPGARFMMKLTPERLYVLVDGEPPGKILIDTFAEATASGALKSRSTLIDLTRFTGSVDWDAVMSLREMTPRGIESASNVAYVVRDKLFATLIKITTAIFPKIRQQAFTARADAIAWLDSVAEQ
jgi:hypothetical protein